MSCLGRPFGDLSALNNICFWKNHSSIIKQNLKNSQEKRFNLCKDHKRLERLMFQCYILNLLKNLGLIEQVTMNGKNMKNMRVTILGVGNILLTDEGFGVQVIKKLEKQYRFPGNVNLVDGNVLGLSLLGTILDSEYLIVVDIVKNKGEPGTFYCLKENDIPKRIMAKNSLHQVGFLEALTLCQLLDHSPEMVIFGVEPKDIETFNDKLSPEIFSRIEETVQKILEELDRMGIKYEEKGAEENVSGHPFENR